MYFVHEETRPQSRNHRISSILFVDATVPIPSLEQVTMAIVWRSFLQTSLSPVSACIGPPPSQISARRVLHTVLRFPPGLLCLKPHSLPSKPPGQNACHDDVRLNEYKTTPTLTSGNFITSPRIELDSPPAPDKIRTNQHVHTRSHEFYSDATDTREDRIPMSQIQPNLPSRVSSDHRQFSLETFQLYQYFSRTSAAQITVNTTTAYQVPTLEESTLHVDDAIISINKEINKGLDIAKIKQSLSTQQAIRALGKRPKAFRTFAEDLKAVESTPDGLFILHNDMWRKNACYMNDEENLVMKIQLAIKCVIFIKAFQRRLNYRLFQLFPTYLEY